MSGPPKPSLSPILTEADLVVRLTTFLRGQGYRVRKEVPNMGQLADVVATKGRWVTFVEAKLTRWQRAIGQCQAHEQVADYICVAIGSERVPSEFLEHAFARGYGIIVYIPASESFRWELQPRVNRQVWPPQRQQWSRLLRGLAYAD